MLDNSCALFALNASGTLRVVLPNSVAERENGVWTGVNSSHLTYLENGGGYERKEQWYSDRGTAPMRPPVVSALIPPSVLEIRSPRLLMRVRLGMLSWVVESAVQSSLTVLASGGSAAAAEDAGV
jgi:hypothetical protein